MEISEGMARSGDVFGSLHSRCSCDPRTVKFLSQDVYILWNFTTTDKGNAFDAFGA